MNCENEYQENFFDTFNSNKMTKNIHFKRTKKNYIQLKKKLGLLAKN